MLLLALKKSLYDYWDHFLRFSLVNFLFIVSLGLIVIIPGYFLQFGFFPFFVSLSLLAILFFTHLGGTTGLCMAIVGIKKTETIAYFKSYISGIKTGFLYGLLQSLIILSSAFAIQYYMVLDNMLAGIAVGLVIWGIILWNLSIFFLYQIKLDLNEGYWKSIKKAALIFFDNSLFTIASALISLAITGLTLLTALLVPGLGGVILVVSNLYRFRMMKYDYLKEHSLKKGEKIPWNLILKEEEQRLNGRKITPFGFKL